MRNQRMYINEEYLYYLRHKQYPFPYGLPQSVQEGLGLNDNNVQLHVQNVLDDENIKTDWLISVKCHLFNDVKFIKTCCIEAHLYRSKNGLYFTTRSKAEVLCQAGLARQYADVTSIWSEHALVRLILWWYMWTGSVDLGC